MSIAQRIKRITSISNDRFTQTPPCPKSVKIEIVPRCNYKCQYCAICFRKEQPTQDMDWGLFKTMTRDMKQAGVEEIGVFYIGESFMNPELLAKSIKFLKQELQIPYVFLTSNASLASYDAVRDCMRLGLDSLKWSCNAADTQQFTELMGMPEVMFGKALANIKAAKEVREKYGYKTKLYASSVKYDANQPARMDTVLKTMILPNVDEHYWLPLYTAGGQAIEKEGKLGMKPIAGNTGMLDDPVDPIPCWTLFTGAHIRADGTMTACCLDGTGYWQVGDLKTQKFMEAWHSQEFKDLRKAHLDNNIKGTKCEKCALFGG